MSPSLRRRPAPALLGDESASGSEKLGHGALALALLFFLALTVLAAWQSDDAFIVFRTVQNFWLGEGLVWNPGERVQSYSCPLWMLVSLVCYGIFGEPYFSTLGASLVLAAFGIGVIALTLCRSPWVASLLILLLSTSRAVVDYSSSGLENALLAAILVLAVVEARREGDAGRPLRAGLLAALACLTRPDAMLLLLPLLVWSLLRGGFSAAKCWRIGAGLAPLIAWEIFSVVYYGSPIPNTALAKLNLDIPTARLALQGLRYFADVVRHDPVTAALLTTGLISTFWKGRVGERMIALGLCLYLLYLLRIGGDFMAGRFFSAPTVCAAALLACRRRSDLPARLGAHWIPVTAGLAGLALLYGATWPGSPWRAGTRYGIGLRGEQVVRASGIADERAYYYPTTGLLRVLENWVEIVENDLPVPPYRGALEARRVRSSGVRVWLTHEVGFFGYFAGREIHVIDRWALSDPLLARLPFRSEGDWRIGHYPRPIPEGYVESVESGDNRIADPDLAHLYASIRSVTRGPLFTAARWREIWRLNTGYYRVSRGARSDR